MSYLHFFTPHNLAMLSDWLEQTGELYVDVRWPYTEGGVDYLICSMQDLRSIALEEWHWPAMTFTIFREQQLPLRGTADKPLLEQALEQFPDGHLFYAVAFAHYPEECSFIDQGTSHAVLLRAFAEQWGHPIAVGSQSLIPNPTQHFKSSNILYIARRRNLQMIRNQEAYAPYDADPARYQWIVEMWQA